MTETISPPSTIHSLMFSIHSGESSEADMVHNLMDEGLEGKLTSSMKFFGALSA